MKNMYQKTKQEVFQATNSRENGLTRQEVTTFHETHGYNILQESKQDSAFVVFIKQFTDVLVFILIAAAIISMLSNEIESAIVILFVVTMNAVLGTIQTLKAQKSLNSLKQLSSPHVRVKREGIMMGIDSSDVCVGDIVYLEAGDVVSGDGRIIECYSLQVNESALTGEVESVNKQDVVLEKETSIADQVNMVFSGGLVTYGRAAVVVTAIGMQSEIGKIATLMNETKQRKSPLQRSLDDFSKKLTVAILVICGIVFLLSRMQGAQLIDAFMFAIALAVAAIPEALASIVTIVLSIGTGTMAKENAIMKNVNAVESLGCVSVICSDKTGTLTQNKMTVQEIYHNMELENKDDFIKNHNINQKLVSCSILCCDAVVENEQRIGDPTELALVDLGTDMGMDIKQFRKKYPRISENPFDSQRKLMATLNQMEDKKIMFVKGACDELLKKTTHIEIHGKRIVFDEESKNKVFEQNHKFAEEGLRVLGFAYKEIENDCIEIKDEENLIFLGLISLMDPPRIESAQAVKECKMAGIKPVMITGDHKITARSIAKSIGIYEDGDECMDGAQLQAMSEEELMKRLPYISVYARVAPEHKIRIVNAWQKLGHIVAMTGDGVNDAPALKQADIGIAMGITGTEVSKDAASMILTDDNFATIVKAVASGRNIYSNIKNAIIYLLSGNFSGILCVLAASLLGYPLPFMPVHLLFINLVTDSLPAIAIGMEPGNANVLKEKPRDIKEGILNKAVMTSLGYQGILIALVTMIAYFIGLKTSYETAATLAFSTLCLARLFHGFNCRNELPLTKLGLFTNRYSVMAFVTGFVLLSVILWVPALHSLFSVVTIDLSFYGMIIGLAVLPTIVIQIIKMIKNR